MRRQALLALLLSGASAAAVAAEPGAGCINLKVSSEARQTVTGPRGRPAVRLAPAEKLGEGEALFYTVSATNICDRPAQTVVIDTPVPQHMVYLAGSAIAPAAQVLFSIDGGFNYAPADVLTVAVSGGQPRPARPDDYTHIRWVLAKPLQPRAVVFARFRAVVK
jgi:uncharacterized repeat protein (TIGR01451 family)